VVSLRHLAVVATLLGCGSSGDPEDAPRPPYAAERPIPDAERAAFCADVLAPEAHSAASEAGVIACSALRPDDGARVDLSVDCRPLHPQLPTLRAALGSASVRELDIGEGGVATAAPDGSSRQLLLVTEVPSCAVTVATFQHDAATTEAIARRVVARLAARPR
jgi:hypothetical protein